MVAPSLSSLSASEYDDEIDDDYEDDFEDDVERGWHRVLFRLFVPIGVFGPGVLRILSEENLLSQAFLLSALVLASVPMFMGLLSGKRLRPATQWILMAGTVLLIAYSISFVASVKSSREYQDPDFLLPLLKVAVSVLVLCFASELKWSDRWLWFLLLTSGILVVGMDVVLCVVRPHTDEGVIIGALHENFVAALGLVGTFFGILAFQGEQPGANRKLGLLLILVSLAAVVVSRGRAVQLSLIMIGMLYPILRFFSRSSLGIHFMFIGMCAMVIAIPITYSSLDNWKQFDRVDQLSQRLTGKELYSGRQKIWGQILQDIEASPLLGYGVHSRDRWEWTWKGHAYRLTAHNTYLTILHEAGVLGMVGAFGLLTVIWGALSSRREFFSCRLGTAFFLGIMFYGSFEVCLCVGDYHRAISLWLLIGCALSRVGEPSREYHDYQLALEDE